MALKKIQNLVTYYKITGKGKPLVLLHGWGGSSRSFLEVQKLLARKCSVIILDLAGFGQTDMTLEPWDVEKYAHFLLAFIESLGLKRVSLAGHSFGGRIAIKFSGLYPEKVENLILIAAAGIKHQSSPEEKAAFFLSRVGKKIFSLPLIHKVKDPARWLFYKMIRRDDYYRASSILKETMKLVIAQDLTPLLSRIQNRTLIIWGSGDEYVPLEDARTMHSLIKDSRLEIIKNASHYLPKKYPKELAGLIAHFLS